MLIAALISAVASYFNHRAAKKAAEQAVAIDHLVATVPAVNAVRL